MILGDLVIEEELVATAVVLDAMTFTGCCADDDILNSESLYGKVARTID